MQLAEWSNVCCNFLKPFNYFFFGLYSTQEILSFKKKKQNNKTPILPPCNRSISCTGEPSTEYRSPDVLARAEYRTRTTSLSLLMILPWPRGEHNSSDTLQGPRDTAPSPWILPPFLRFRQLGKWKQSSLCVCRSYRNTVTNGSLMLKKLGGGHSLLQDQWKSGSTLIPTENKACYYRWNSTDSTLCMAISRCSKHQLVFQPVPCGFRFGSNHTKLICTLAFCSLGHKVWFDILMMFVLWNHLSFTLVKNGGSGILSNFSNTFINIKILWDLGLRKLNMFWIWVLWWKWMKNTVPENSYLLKQKQSSCVSFTLISTCYLINIFLCSLVSVIVKADLDVQSSSVKCTPLFMPCFLNVFPPFQSQSPYSRTMAINIQSRTQTIFFLYLSQTPFSPENMRKCQNRRKTVTLRSNLDKLEVWAHEGQTQYSDSGSGQSLISTQTGEKWV